ncbi:hypothetical protein LTR78_007059 [Recurvomyces mirabilis]|uniref:Methyltransferase domain-containing protein n=1 Tax=Recurvomyces mirabilis TaxID=574656 RepID=A0AAE1BYY4_9PEZI|nr:hypothetical protein LTR78_007059 [Recurvomyces mirabilis]KAK5150969.1 hypothetical protein LTS14_009773 [Recurvomyces mirabilis]
MAAMKENPIKPKMDMQQFYDEADPKLSEDARSILTKYSGIPAAELIPHLRTVRDKAWNLFKYPCVGQWAFIRFGILKDPVYPSIVERLQDGQTLLDLACCFGQDMRKLVVDGAPSENLTGTELEGGFVNLGYELFNDRDKLKSHFIIGDFFDKTTLNPERDTFDMIHAASFFHLFSRDEQVEAVTKALRSLKSKPGSMLFGRQTAVANAGAIKLSATRSGEMYRHTPESWKELLEQVVKQMALDAECSVEPTGDQKLTTGVGIWNMVRFCVILR